MGLVFDSGAADKIVDAYLDIPGVVLAGVGVGAGRHFIDLLQYEGRVKYATKCPLFLDRVTCPNMVVDIRAGNIFNAADHALVLTLIFRVGLHYQSSDRLTVKM